MPKSRARDLGVPFDGATGAFNAITDVPGVAIGHTTLISGEPPLEVGVGPVRTGVTAILPLGQRMEAVAAAWFSLNGNGEMTGTAFIDEFGLLAGPIMFANTHSLGAVHEATIKYMLGRNHALPWCLPVVGETYDGLMNDINGFHVREEHALAALAAAAPGPVAEGSVGGGTGMIAYEFKAGIGTSSRHVGSYHVGVLVQANHGRRDQLLVGGVSLGRMITEHRLVETTSSSILVAIATDAPLLPMQLKALCKRAAMGLARTGATAGMTSGDLFIAFSTANKVADFLKPFEMRSVGGPEFSVLYDAAALATEEAIINALVAADTTVDVNGKTVLALPHERVRECFLPEL